MILFFIAVCFLITEKYFLNYKVVLVEENLQGEFDVVKEIIVNGKVTDSILFINTTIPEHNFSKLIIENRCQTDAQCVDT